MYSISKNKLKEFAALKQSKIREERGLFLVEGVKMVEEAINSSHEVIAVCGVESFWNTHSFTSTHNMGDTYLVSERELSSLSLMKTPNQAVAILKQQQISVSDFHSENELILMLESVRDPGNLGTILRIADWFGIRHVFCSPDTVEVHNPKTIQATMGSFFRVDVFYVDVLKELHRFREHHDMPVFGLALHGENIYSTPLPKRGVLIVGNESKGLSAEILNIIDTALLIPSYLGSGAESLNVAMATAIACSEFRRATIAVLH